MEDEKIDVPLIRPKKSKGKTVEYIQMSVKDIIKNNDVELKNSKKSNMIINDKKTSDIEFVNEDTLISQVVSSYPSTLWIFSQAGMHCIGCPASAFESIKDGCLAHGMNDVEINLLIKRLNEHISAENKKGD